MFFSLLAPFPFQIKHSAIPPQALASVTPNDNLEVSGASVTQAASTTTLTFTRPLAPTDSGKTELSSEEGERANFIWAYGSSNTLAFHESWGAVALSDLFCTTELSAGAGDEDCTSSDPDYEFEVAPSGDADELALFWSVVGSSVSVKV